MSADPYTSKERVKISLNILASDTSKDDDIDSMILGVSQAFDTAINASFTKETVIEYHSGQGQSALPLNRIPTENAASRDAIVVVENGVMLTVDDDWALDAHPARLLYRTTGVAEQFAGAVWPVGCRNIKVTYDDEYTAIPNDVSDAARRETHRIFRATNIDGKGERIGLDSVAPEAGDSLSFSASDFDPRTIALLASYRQHFQIL